MKQFWLDKVDVTQFTASAFKLMQTILISCNRHVLYEQCSFWTPLCVKVCWLTRAAFKWATYVNKASWLLHNHRFKPLALIVLPSCSFLIKSEEKKTAHFQKLAINKKSTIFVPSSWNWAKMIASWVNHFHQVSWG